MEADRKSNWGLLAILAGAVFAAAAYLVVLFGAPTDIPFAIALYVLLGSLFVMMFDALVKSRMGERG